jgi:hypothetical protein
MYHIQKPHAASPEMGRFLDDEDAWLPRGRLLQRLCNHSRYADKKATNHRRRTCLGAWEATMTRTVRGKVASQGPLARNGLLPLRHPRLAMRSQS